MAGVETDPIIAVDPGGLSGVAILTDDGSVVTTCEQIEHLETLLEGFARRWPDALWTYERSIQGGDSQHSWAVVRRAMNVVLGVAPDAEPYCPDWRLPWLEEAARKCGYESYGVLLKHQTHPVDALAGALWFQAGGEHPEHGWQRLTIVGAKYDHDQVEVEFMDTEDRPVRAFIGRKYFIKAIQMYAIFGLEATRPFNPRELCGLIKSNLGLDIEGFVDVERIGLVEKFRRLSSYD